MFDSNALANIERTVNMDSSKVRPLKGELFFTQIPETTRGGLILPSGYITTSDTIHGVVTSVNGDCLGLQVGDKIIAEKHYSLQLDFTNGQHFKVPASHVLAVLGESNTDS